MTSNSLRTLLFSAMMAISATNGCHGTQPPKTQEATMTESNDPILSLLSLPDIQYSTLSDDDISNLSLQLSDLQRELYEEVEAGYAPPPPDVWISTPKKMSFQEGNSQLLMGLVSHGQRKWEVYPTSNIFLVLRHINTGQLWIKTPLLNSRRGRAQPRSAFGTEPNPDQAATWSAGVQRINIIDKFPSTLPLGMYSATVLYYDLVSNSAHFSLLGKEGQLLEAELHVMGSIMDTLVNVPEKVSLGDSKPFEFKAKLSNKTTSKIWHGNVIALILDEAPIIIPISGDESTVNLSVNIDMQEKTNEWQVGNYQIYVDVGDNIIGPFGMKVTK